VSAVSAVTGFVLAQYSSVDALSSLIFIPDDCTVDWGMSVGRHCFSDYPMTVSFGTRPNPWEPYPIHTQSGWKTAYNNYPAAGILPQMLFGVLGKWLGAARLGLFGYLLAMTIAALTPAVWAARGARGLERVVVFVACGIAAIPAWMAIDRGNPVAFLAPVALVLLVALCRRRWGLVTIMVILAALLKPQFALLAVALFAARKWRWGGIAVAGAGIANIAVYLLWPRDFPGTITQSMHNVLSYGTFHALVVHFNVSFAKGLLMIPDGIKARETGGTIPDGFLAAPRSLIGYAIVVLVVVCVLALGRRMPAVMAGIVLLATAALFPALSLPYYLVFVLPVAALIARDPDGPPGTGIFDRPASVGGERRAIGVCMSLAVALCIAHIALPGPPIHADIAGQVQVGTTGIVDRAVVSTTVFLAPLLWLITFGAIFISYARRPAPWSRSEHEPAQEVSPDPADGGSDSPEQVTEFFAQPPA
jgi:hypothetical protein